jgi:predicted pyridoxine 5'-phosphate oxidase superfamily flavin-nucleotide-binding protein
MVNMPQIVQEAWENREGPIVLATVDREGTPNAIYATCVGQFSPSMWVVADNYFDKTQANILSGSRGSLLFITKDGKSYQVKGRIEYHTEGEVYDDMKRWNPTKHPGHGAAALHAEQVFSGAKQLV